MKKLSVLLCLLLLLLAGCGSNGSKNSTVPKIEDYSWQMTTVQSTDAEGQVIAHKPGSVGVPETSIEIVLSCTAKDGTLNILDETNGQTYTGIYKLIDTSEESIIYEVTVGDTKGTAVVSMTTYHDETQTPTFIIGLEDYTFNFFSAD